MSKTVKIGLIGSGFVADIHAHSIQHHVPNAEVLAVASPTPVKREPSRRSVVFHTLLRIITTY